MRVFCGMFPTILSNKVVPSTYSNFVSFSAIISFCALSFASSICSWILSVVVVVTRGCTTFTLLLGIPILLSNNSLYILYSLELRSSSHQNISNDFCLVSCSNSAPFFATYSLNFSIWCCVSNGILIDVKFCCC